MNVEGHLNHPQLERLVDVLTRYTTTPDDCFFGLWDGFGDIHGSPAVRLLRVGRGKPAGVPPAFPPEVLAGPRVEIPGRSYLLFRGPLLDAGQWGAADLAPGQPRSINSPNLMWLFDRTWFVLAPVTESEVARLRARATVRSQSRSRTLGGCRLRLVAVRRG